MASTNDEDEIFDSLEPDENATPTMECLGLELDYSIEAFGVPVDVLIVAKVIYDGQFTYRLISTKELNSVEAMGMLRWGQMLLERGIWEHCEDEVEVDDDTGEQPPIT